jgi:ubiquitin carboxyl-terminal hydrolase MINDY-3/4
VVILHGISTRACVGFLTLQEAYNYIEVGVNFKKPLHPVWVIYSESHYSVLFSNNIALVEDDDIQVNNNNNKMKSKETRSGFDLYYWDMLANQKEEIKLTVKLDHSEELPDVNDDRALIPPIDLVIRTKWRGAFVDWNGTEEIL